MTWSLLLGLTIPSLVVLLAVFLMFRMYFRHQVQILLYESKTGRSGTTLPLKLQALERLTLLCERIHLPDLILRLKTPGTSAGELKAALLIAIQQEYEHNLTQQLYVSEELWNILISAKERTMEMIDVASKQLSPGASADDFAHTLIEMASQETSLPSQIAKKAVKTESALWL